MNLMHSCKRVAELLSQQLDEPLGLFDTLQLRLHLSMCGDCSHVAQQLKAVHAASADLFGGDLDLDDDGPPSPGPNPVPAGRAG